MGATRFHIENNLTVKSQSNVLLRSQVEYRYNGKNMAIKLEAEQE